MIDVTRETLISRAEAARLLKPKGCKAVSTVTIYRWMTKGKRGVKLEYVDTGSTMMTSVEAVQRFSDALVKRRQGVSVEEIGRSSQQPKPVGFVGNHAAAMRILQAERVA